MTLNFVHATNIYIFYNITVYSFFPRQFLVNNTPQYINNSKLFQYDCRLHLLQRNLYQHVYF